MNVQENISSEKMIFFIQFIFLKKKNSFNDMMWKSLGYSDLSNYYWQDSQIVI
jgi:hypothetical protein